MTEECNMARWHPFRCGQHPCALNTDKYTGKFSSDDRRFAPMLCGELRTRKSRCVYGDWVVHECNGQPYPCDTPSLYGTEAWSQADCPQLTGTGTSALCAGTRGYYNGHACGRFPCYDDGYEDLELCKQYRLADGVFCNAVEWDANKCVLSENPCQLVNWGTSDWLDVCGDDFHLQLERCDPYGDWDSSYCGPSPCEDVGTDEVPMPGVCHPIPNAPRALVTASRYVSVSWDPVSDPFGNFNVTAYELYLNDRPVARVPADGDLEYTFLDLAAETEYVSARKGDNIFLSFLA